MFYVGNSTIQSIKVTLQYRSITDVRVLKSRVKVFKGNCKFPFVLQKIPSRPLLVFYLFSLFLEELENYAAYPVLGEIKET